MASPKSKAPSSAAAAAAASAVGAKVGHVIWGSVNAFPDNSGEVSSCRSVSSGQLENVMFQDWSGSGESVSHSQTIHSDSVNAQRLSKSSSISNNNAGCNSGTDAIAALLEAGNDQAQEARAVLIRDGMWSVGSENHIEGTCRPCHYVHAARGCASGQDCTFCHLPHVQASNRSRNRPCKKKREQCKKILDLVSNIAESGNNAQVLQVVQNVACQSAYMQNMLQKSVQLPGQDQEPVPGDEHNPAVEAGSESVLEQTGASASKPDRTKRMLQMVQVPADIHHLGASGCELQRASPALPSHERRRSLVSL